MTEHRWCWTEVLGILILLGMLIGQCLWGIQTHSPTSDEQNHISRGYNYLVTGRLDLNVAPPFVKALSALPLLAHPEIVIPDYDVTHRRTFINQFAEEFVWVYNDARTIINSGRLAIVFLSVLLAVFVHRWARDLWGPAAGLLALFLYVLDPNIVAHSHLVTTDLGVACLGFIATYFLWRFLQGRKRTDLAQAGVVLGLALATKQSALLLVPLFVAIVAFEAAVRQDCRLRNPEAQPQNPKGQQSVRSLQFMAAVLLVLALTTFLALWASYRFETAALSAPKTEHVTIDRLISVPWVREIAYRLAESPIVPFPTYFSGIAWLRRYAQRGAPAFLMGQQSTRGWWYYFLVAFAIKTPLPTLILLAAACFGWRRLRKPGPREYVLYVPIVAYFGVSFLRLLNIGYRHILVVLPFAFVIASSVVTGIRRKGTRLAMVGLCLWLLVSTVRISPHYLAYFNELIGGPRNGFRYLVDSNLDWGQDLENLKRYMDRHGIPAVRLAYFGSARPDYYGIVSQPVPLTKPDGLENGPAEVYAISATLLQNGYLDDRLAFSWLREYEPFAHVGYSILLFHLP